MLFLSQFYLYVQELCLELKSIFERVICLVCVYLYVCTYGYVLIYVYECMNIYEHIIYIFSLWISLIRCTASKDSLPLCGSPLIEAS